MPSLGGGSVDIRSIIGNIVNFAKSKAIHAATAPCDGFVLKMHYRWTFFLFIGGFFSVWYNWYHRDIITCVSHFNAETQVRLDYINICLSYPYIQYDGESRRYLMFYRWIHWTFFVLAGVYYIPRKVSKSFENPKTKKLIEDLAQNASRIDNTESQLLELSSKYLFNNLKTHNGLYFKYLCLNFLALLIDLFALHFLDFVLQGRFLRYGYNAYPFDRDPKTFTDYMSVMFPPFASCELDKENQLTALRKEKLGCHLTFMELYEKIFLFLWLWLIILILVTSLYIIFIILMILPGFRLYVLRSSKPIHGYSDDKRVAQNIVKVSKNCKVGDIYILYRIKQHLSHAKFYELMNRISTLELKPNPSNNEKMTTIDMPDGLSKPHPENLRNRKNPQIQQMLHPQANYPSAPVNPEFLQQLISNPSNLPNIPQHAVPTGKSVVDMQQKTPLLKPPNKSLLID